MDNFNTSVIAHPPTRSCQIKFIFLQYKAKPKGCVYLNRLGQRVRSSHSRKDEQAQREPWLLGSSLPEGFRLAEKVVKLYTFRMQTDEAFRDLKSIRFGLSLELHRTYQVESQGQGPALLGAPRMQRLQVLLLVATPALLVAWLMGKATELTGQHRHYRKRLGNGMVSAREAIG